MATLPQTCLFTNAPLIPYTKVEHTILRALGGRIKSRRVTSSDFNERSSNFDKLLSDQYKLIMNVLAPVLPEEFNPGAMPVTLDNGWKAVQDKGITRLKGMEITERDQSSGKPKSCFFPDDSAAIRRIAGKAKLNLDYNSLYKVPMPGKIAYHDDIPLCTTPAEISAIKCVLCSFDEVCQDKNPDFIFTRDESLAPIRTLVEESISNPENRINLESLDRHYLGVQLDAAENIKKSLSLFKHTRTAYEHIILISSNSAKKTIDVIWDLLGIEVHGIRLTNSWRGIQFCGIIVNPILPGKIYNGIILQNEENPFLKISRTTYKSFAWASEIPQPQKEIPHILAKLKRDAYHEAVAYIENNATEFQKENFMYSVNELSDSTYTMADIIKQRLIRLYESSYNGSEFEGVIAEEMKKLERWQSTPAKDILQMSDEDFDLFIADYRSAFNALNSPFHPPGKMFTQKIDFQIIPVK